MPSNGIVQGTTHTEGNVLIDRMMYKVVLILICKGLLYSMGGAV